jgi:hypothetical protein
MPKYGDDNGDDDKAYDAGGDSFGSIFSDLFTGASSAAAYTAGARGGIFRDFIEFLESNVDGYSSAGSDDDAQLRILLQTGTLQEIGDEMDDTDLVVQQLGAKLGSVQDELVMLEAQVKGATRYLEKLDLEERVAELQARKKVVEGYIKKARKRLLSLQTRYKQLIVNGDNDVKAGGRSPTGTSSRNDSTGQSSYSAAGYTSTSTSTSGSSSTGNSDSSRSSASRKSSTSEEDAWKNDSFGSFGRGRSTSSRQRTRHRSPRTTEPPRTTTTTASSSSSSSSSTTTGASDSSQSAAPSRDSTYRSDRSTYQDTSSTRQTQGSQEPPHRRQSSSRPQDQDDTRRMRDLKVDDEFEKLKKELGL